jgi:hypothetical protein
LGIHCHCTKRSKSLAVVVNTNAAENNGDMIRQKKKGSYIIEEGKEDISTTFDTEQVETIHHIDLES